MREKTDHGNECTKVLRRRETEKICERRKVERRNSIFVRHISSNGHSWSKSIWIKEHIMSRFMKVE